RDIILGYDDQEFRPAAHMTNAEALTLLTRAFSLKKDEQVNAQQDTITNVEQNKWYSDAYVAAQHNGVVLSKEVKANDTVTREQFASWIIDQLDRIDVYPVIKMYIHIED